MGPIWMAAIIVGLTSAFAWSAKKRFELLSTGRPEARFDRIPARIKGVVEYALLQRKMHYYPLAGLAHMLIFVAFSVLRDGTEELVIAAECGSTDAMRLRTEIPERVNREVGVVVSHVALVAVGALPKTSSGKAQRRKSKAMFEAKELQEHA